MAAEIADTWATQAEGAFAAAGEALDTGLCTVATAADVAQVLVGDVAEYFGVDAAGPTISIGVILEGGESSRGLLQQVAEQQRLLDSLGGADSPTGATVRVDGQSMSVLSLRDRLDKDVVNMQQDVEKVGKGDMTSDRFRSRWEGSTRYVLDEAGQSDEIVLKTKSYDIAPRPTQEELRSVSEVVPDEDVDNMTRERRSKKIYNKMRRFVRKFHPNSLFENPLWLGKVALNVLKAGIFLSIVRGLVCQSKGGAGRGNKTTEATCCKSVFGWENCGQRRVDHAPFQQHLRNKHVWMLHPSVRTSASTRRVAGKSLVCGTPKRRSVP